MNCKRVACLYRVSHNSQVEDNDIPMQRIECHQFIDDRTDWILIDEYYENGVSGYKKTAQQRDILHKLKQDASDHKFDILLLFMFDRLGRIDKETPFILEWFNKQGIEVWSTQEGKASFDDHNDKLINYIRFWQSNGESVNTSIRVDAKHMQMAKEGLFRGGSAPFGYKILPSGLYNKTGKEIGKLVINEDQALIIKKIYYYAAELNYGKTKIARLLNDDNIPSSKGGKWNSCVVGVILKNPVYKGYPAYRKKTNKTGVSHNLGSDEWVLPKVKNNDISIINEEQWEKVQVNIKNRYIYYGNKNNIHSTPLLFVGIINCGYCNSPMTTTYIYRYDNKKSITERLPQYRCSGKATKQNNCSGKIIYNGKMIESFVFNQTKKYLQLFYNPIISKSKKVEIIKLKNNDIILKQEEKKIKKEYDILLQKVSDIIMGKFNDQEYDNNQLELSIITKKKELDENLIRQTNIKEQTKFLITSIEDQNLINKVTENWDKLLIGVSHDIKKELFRKIIKSITIFRDDIKIDFKEDLHEFLMDYKKYCLYYKL